MDPLATPDEAFPARHANATPLRIDASAVAIGEQELPYEPGDVSDLLRSFVALVETVRGGPLGDVIHLRRDDLYAIADHLSWPLIQVVDSVAGLLGAADREHRALTTLIAAGAEVVGIRPHRSIGPLR